MITALSWKKKKNKLNEAQFLNNSLKTGQCLRVVRHLFWPVKMTSLVSRVQGMMGIIRSTITAIPIFRSPALFELEKNQLHLFWIWKFRCFNLSQVLGDEEPFFSYRKIDDAVGWQCSSIFPLIIEVFLHVPVWVLKISFLALALCITKEPEKVDQLTQI